MRTLRSPLRQNLIFKWTNAEHTGLPEDIAAIGAGVQAAFKAKDVDWFINLHTDDCLIAAPGTPFVKKADMRPMVEKMMADAPEDMGIKIIDVTPMGSDHAVVRLNMTLKMMGQPVPMWEVIALRKTGPEWKVFTRCVGPVAFPPGMAPPPPK